jgi:hypothetical protein
MNSTMTLQRRTALSIGLAGVMSLRAFGARAVTDATCLQRFIKMRGALDGRLVIGSVTGQYNGVVNGKVTPLFGLVSAVFSRYQAKHGGYEVTEFEQAYYTDLVTGKVLTNWQNPYTNETVTVPVYSDPAAALLITPDLQFHASAVPPPSVHVQHVAEGPDISKGQIIFVERVSVSVAPAAGKPAFFYKDHTTLTAKLAVVDNPDTKMASSKTHFSATCSWRPWLNMGARPGYMSADGNGRFGVALGDLPAAWREATAHVRPELLEQH